MIANIFHIIEQLEQELALLRQMVLQVISNDAPVDQELIVDAEFVQEGQEVAVVVEEGAIVEALQAPPRPMHPTTRRELREATQA